MEKETTMKEHCQKLLEVWVENTKQPFLERKINEDGLKILYQPNRGLPLTSELRS